MKYKVNDVVEFYDHIIDNVGKVVKGTIIEIRHNWWQLKPRYIVRAENKNTYYIITENLIVK